MRCIRDGDLIAMVLATVTAVVGCKQTASAAKERAAHEPAVQTVTATLERVHGDVRWDPAASGAWEPASPNQALHADDGVQTMEDGRATVRFTADDAQLSLSPMTTLRIPWQSPAVMRVKHVAGRMVARLRRRGEKRRMEVQLPPGTLVLDETTNGGQDDDLTAQVSVDAEQTSISMISGAGRFERRSGRPIDLKEAHYVKLDAHGSLLDSGEVGPTVQPIIPADGATIETQGPVKFEWTRLKEPVQSYELTVKPDRGAARIVEIDAKQSSATVMLPSGHFAWTVRGLNDGEALPSEPPRGLEVRIDRVPPALTLQSPSPGAEVSTPTVRVAGRTEPGARVDVNGKTTPVDTDGRFSAEEPVARGLSNVVVRARDEAGNERAVSRAVVRE